MLLGYALDRAEARSRLRVLDAMTLEDVASVQLPGRVPAGFHGNWAPEGTDPGEVQPEAGGVRRARGGSARSGAP